MPLNDHNNIELVPHHHNGACPLYGGFRQKEAAPIKRGGIKQVYLLASLKTQRERRNVARGLPFPERDPREARERAGKGKPRADN